MTHTEIAELLGAWALDAVDDDERQAVAAHLDECPRCRAEVAQHLEVAALLANCGADAPEGLWDRISDFLEAGPAPLELAPVVSLDEARRATERIVAAGPSDAGASSGASGPGGRGGDGGPGGRGRGGVRGDAPRRSRRDRRIPVRMAAAVGAVAAVVIAALGFQIQRLDHRTNQLAARVNSQQGAARLPAVMNRPGTTAVVLRDTAGRVLATAYVPPTGDAVLDLRALPPLPAGQEYQLWGVEDTATVSLRLLGSRPDVTDFRMAPGVQALAVTAERVGGVVASQQQPVAVGRVTT